MPKLFALVAVCGSVLALMLAFTVDRAVAMWSGDVFTPSGFITFRAIPPEFEAGMSSALVGGLLGYASRRMTSSAGLVWVVVAAVGLIGFGGSLLLVFGMVHQLPSLTWRIVGIGAAFFVTADIVGARIADRT